MIPRSVAAGDMLYGLREIANFLGIRHRAAMHLAKQKRIPTWFEGRVVCSRKTLLRDYLDAKAAEVRQPAVSV